MRPRCRPRPAAGRSRHVWCGDGGVSPWSGAGSSCGSGSGPEAASRESSRRAAAGSWCARAAASVVVSGPRRAAGTVSSNARSATAAASAYLPAASSSRAPRCSRPATQGSPWTGAASSTRAMSDSGSAARRAARAARVKRARRSARGTRLSTTSAATSSRTGGWVPARSPVAASRGPRSPPCPVAGPMRPASAASGRPHTAMPVSVSRRSSGRPSTTAFAWSCRALSTTRASRAGFPSPSQRSRTLDRTAGTPPVARRSRTAVARSGTWPSRSATVSRTSARVSRAVRTTVSSGRPGAMAHDEPPWVPVSDTRTPNEAWCRRRSSICSHSWLRGSAHCRSSTTRSSGRRRADSRTVRQYRCSAAWSIGPDAVGGSGSPGRGPHAAIRRDVVDSGRSWRPSTARAASTRTPRSPALSAAHRSNVDRPVPGSPRTTAKVGVPPATRRTVSRSAACGLRRSGPAVTPRRHGRRRPTGRARCGRRRRASGTRSSGAPRQCGP